MSQYPCSNCGANVEFAPGTSVLRCPYCGGETLLASTGMRVREHSFAEFAGLPRKPVTALAANIFTCRGCGAVTESDKISDRCQFCGAPLVADATSGEMVAPEAVLPFGLDRGGLREALRTWSSSRWFAPNGLKKVTEAESAHSTYLPHWTYDASTTSRYTGQRGVYYWVSVTHSSNGTTRTTQERRTRWYAASGVVARDFDDVVVVGTTKVRPKHLAALAPWPLPEAQRYRPEYLVGHETLRYDVEPETGLGEAKSQMAQVIHADCKRAIGGDEQRVTSLDTEYRDVMFKLMLLPVWIACYLHAGRTYNVLVNGRTGKVAGERPYSLVKIVAASVAVLAVIALIVILFSLNWHTTG